MIEPVSLENWKISREKKKKDWKFKGAQIQKDNNYGRLTFYV